MVEIMKKILYISLLIVLTAACQSQKELVTVDKDTDTITLKKGEDCEIKFITNASTGYRWQWINRAEITVVDSIGDRYVSNAPPGMVGASSTRYWKFKAVQKGTQILKFVYARSSRNEAVKTRDITITVK